MFNSDRPIKNSNQDILERAPFAESLGEAIVKYKNEDSIVIGLYGTWGCGKTSLINMTIEYIEKVKDSQPIIFKFNPWNYSDQKQLIAQFFSQLSFVLNQKNSAENAKEVGEKIEAYAKFFTPLSYIPTIGPFAKVVKDVLESVGASTKSWGEMKSEDLEDKRNTLEKALIELQRKIIIIIDDVDRLNCTEIRQIFQLVKSIGDLPNIVYLLSFDKDVVKKALAEVQKGTGEDYLEKIIQIPFEIPQIDKSKIEKLLFRKLDNLIVDIPEEKWDKTYLGNVYHSGIKYFFNNIRDVQRFINTLSFSFSLIEKEVYAIDLIAVTALQVFVPNIYHGIRSNKELFTKLYNSYSRHDHPISNDKSLYEGIVKNVDESIEGILKELLKIIFPKLQAVFGNTHYGNDWARDWKRERRICSPDFFETYFKLSLDENNISKVEMESLISISNDRKAFSLEIIKLIENRKIIKVLDQFENYTNIVPIANISSIIGAFMDIGDMIPEEETGFTFLDSSMRLLRISHQLLSRLENKEDRFNILRKAIDETKKSLYTIVHEVSVQDQEHGKFDYKEKSKSEEELTLNSEQLNILNDLACKKIEEWAADGRLLKHRNFQAIMYRWRDWGNNDDVVSYVEDITNSDDGLVKFIKGFVSSSTSYGLGDYTQKLHWHIYLKALKEFIDIDKIEPRIRGIFNSANYDMYDGKDKQAIELFLDTYDGKISDDLFA